MTATAPPVPSLRRRKRERTADRIYAAAVKLFVERGFDETTVQDIADAAGVGKGTFFNYFPTKEGVLSRFLEQRGLESLEVVARPVAPGTTATSRLVGLFDSLADHLLEDVALSRLVLVASLRSRLLVAANQAVSQDFRIAFRTILKEGQARSEYRQDIPVDRVSEYLAAIFFRVLRDYLEYQQDFDLKDRLREAVLLMIGGIETRHIETR